MDTLLLRPEHSFIRQSVHAWKASHAVSGDGAGVGWYGREGEPGVYRDTRPAWNDENLHSLAVHVSSHMFLAHVRATSGTPIQRSNCHPFRHDGWLFQHNGDIGEYHRLKRTLDQAVRQDLYASMQGSTDSERMLFLALTLGLEQDPPRALARMAGEIELVGRTAGVGEPLRMTVAAADGRRIFAARYSSGGASPSLYYSSHPRALRSRNGRENLLPEGAVIVLSEPLDEMGDHWIQVPEGSLLVVEEGGVRLESFAPERG